jgi:uncharacterized membrane protein YphA (DoxX/SURF4 family)
MTRINIATAAEALLGVALILGIFRRPVAFASDET